MRFRVAADFTMRGVDPQTRNHPIARKPLDVVNPKSEVRFIFRCMDASI